MEKKKVLIIDDEQSVLNFLLVLLTQAGKYEARLLLDSADAAEELRSGHYDVVLLDMDMPDVTGLDILRFIQENHIDVEALVLTGVDDVELAVAAMKCGAYDYLRKPVDNDLLLLTLDRAMERRNMRREIAELRVDAGREGLKRREAFEEIVTQSPRMFRIFNMVEKIGPTDAGVLIMGESGTGKELIAKAIHRTSARAARPFVAVNAGAFARELFASEFFGHVRGAFSGAHSDKRGFLEEAGGGTLFLDEIGELPMEVQVKLLRVLQDGEFFRVGSTRPMRADVRLIAATNKNLWEEIEHGQFRKDLFYRLNVNAVFLPPLREREGDVGLLARHFLSRFNEHGRKSFKGLSEGLMALLEEYDFPGNVRELQNIIGSAAVLETSDLLTVASLPEELLGRLKKESGPQHPGDSEAVSTLEEVERGHIRRVLERTGGNKTHAAKLLGISRVTLVAKLKKYDRQA